jgi:hypothetical protein
MPELTSTVLDYRVDRILEMGFTPGQAVRLAEVRDSKGNLVDLHELRRTLRGGCPLDTAFLIYS